MENLFDILFIIFVFLSGFLLCGFGYLEKENRKLKEDNFFLKEDIKIIKDKRKYIKENLKK